MRPARPLLLALRWVPFAAAAAGCAVGPDYRAPHTDLPTRWSESAPAAAPGSAPRAPAAADLAAWWRSFHDPQLDALIERATRTNPDLALATSRIREARAERAATADAQPTLEATGSYARERESRNAPNPVLVEPGGQIRDAGQTDDLFAAGFDAGWELDAFGARRRAVEAADARLQAAGYDRDAALVSLCAEVARDYIELRASQRVIALVHADLAAQQDRLRLARARQAGGMASALDVAAVEGLVATADARLPQLESAEHTAVHRLAVLLGEPPDALQDLQRNPAPIPVADDDLPAALPSDLLRQRPDLRAAERRVAAATADIGVATAELYPKFSLLGLAGLTSLGAGNFFDSASQAWSIGPTFSWPILRRGRVVANIAVRRARGQQALLAYRRAILGALADVEDALAAYRGDCAQREQLLRAVQADRRASELAGGLYTGGLIDYRAVLDAQHEQSAARLALARSQEAAAIDRVALYKALGGGWQGDAPCVGTTHPNLACSESR